MPWVKQEDCVGCGSCVEGCPVGTISIDNEKAFIIMEGCIRCGKCHEICPQKAVRHDKEKEPFEIEKNIEKTKWILTHYEDEQEKQEVVKRIIKHFDQQKAVAEKTIEKIEFMR